MDDVIPATLGGTGTVNGTQDAIIDRMRPSDSILLESDAGHGGHARAAVGRADGPPALRGYATAIHRQPTGIASDLGDRPCRPVRVLVPAEITTWWSAPPNSPSSAASSSSSAEVYNARAEGVDDQTLLEIVGERRDDLFGMALGD
jgi:hypothetical protein